MSTVYLYMKHNDCANISIDDVEHQGYMPYVNQILGGDDTQLKIDNETGKIIGWTPIQIEDNKFVEI
jgi:hypothetical protein